MAYWGSDMPGRIDNQGLIFGSLRASSFGIFLSDGGTVINGGSVFAGSPGNKAEILCKTWGTGCCLDRED